MRSTDNSLPSCPLDFCSSDNQPLPLSRKGRGKSTSRFNLHPSLKKRVAFTLAEGATHVDTTDNVRRAAFTLAEVLITLGIIGVVAALTLPSLIADYREKELVTRDKRSYSVIMNAINAFNADNESIGDNSTLMDSSKTNEEIITNFSKYFNGAILCNQNGKQKCNLSYKIKYSEPINNGNGQNAYVSMFGDAMLLNDGAIVGLIRETTNPGSCFFN